jgi:hypothetical protein
MGIGPLTPTVRPWLHVVSVLGLSPLGLTGPLFADVRPGPELLAAPFELDTSQEPSPPVVRSLFPSARLDALPLQNAKRIIM